MQRTRLRHSLQFRTENLIVSVSLEYLYIAGVQLILVRPPGHVDTFRSQSISKLPASMPFSARACHS
jgi:hypothetical protein